MRQEHLDIVDRYLEGSLSEQERTAFEERLLQDEKLQQQVDDMKLIRAGIIHASRKAALQNLKTLENTLPLVEVKVIRFWTNTWLQAAAALLIGLLAYTFWPSSVNEQELFATHFEVYPNIIMPTVRGVVENDSTVKAQAFRAYDQQDYVLAIQLFEKLSVQDEAVLLYLGNSYLASGQPEKALLLFERVLNNYDVFDEQAEWYVAVTYLKLEEREKAREALQKVVARESSYKAKALLILEKLN
jgi:tetratricopeptide (TPR) repeat protein